VDAILKLSEEELVLENLKVSVMPSALASAMVGATALTVAMVAGLLSVRRL